MVIMYFSISRKDGLIYQDIKPRNKVYIKDKRTLINNKGFSAVDHDLYVVVNGTEKPLCLFSVMCGHDFHRLVKLAEKNIIKEQINLL